jgi:hypothetical protein
MWLSFLKRLLHVANAWTTKEHHEQDAEPSEVPEEPL